MSRDQVRVIIVTVLGATLLVLTPSRFWLPIGAGIGLILLFLLSRWIWHSYRDFRRAPAAAALRRQQILTAQFAIGTTAGKPDVPTGLAMDWNLGDALATLVVFDDGTTSLFFSPGGGIVGAARFEDVARAARVFREQAHRLRSRLTPVTSFPPPTPNHVVFYAIGDSATLSSGELHVDDVRRDAHPFCALERTARELMGGICRTTPGVARAVERALDADGRSQVG